ncbi:MAG: THUMP domain-containing protein, partial [Bacteroidota bacterium]
AKTVSGMEPLLLDELNALGALDAKVVTRAVAFRGDLELLYRTNYLCRTALRILKPIHTFTAWNEQELYDEVRKVNWPEYLTVKNTFAIDAVASNSEFTHTKYLAQKVKDGIVDQFRDSMGIRPSVDITNPDIRIDLHVNGSDCTLSLDSSGSSLHKRGYRRNTHEAQANEVLAAGMVLLSQWDRKSPLIDFMCGSGTILIEAAMAAYNIPAGYYRKEWSFMQWNDFDKKLWKLTLDRNEPDIRATQGPEILGSDISTKSIAQCRENITHCGLQDKISVKKQDFIEFEPPEAPGVLILNPPYGERMEVDDIISLYREIGDELKLKFSGYSAWIISSDMQALKFVGLHPRKKYKVFNGPLECRFAGFDLYAGSKKQKNKE